MRLPSLKALHYFTIVGDTLSFKHAAEKLFVSQAAVSQQIKKLEDELGLKLFVRHGNDTQLTHPGKTLLPSIDSAFKQIQSSIESLEVSNTQRLMVSCTHSFSTYCLVPKLRDFQLAYPEIAFHLSPDNHLLSATNFSADIAIRIGSPVNKGLETRELVQSRFVLAYSPLLAKDDQTLNSMIHNVPFLLDESEDISMLLRPLCDKVGIDFSALNIALRVNDSVPIINNLLAGNGIGVVNSVLVAEQIKNKQLVVFKNEGVRGQYDVFVTAPADHFKIDKVCKFLAWLYAQEFEL